MSPKYYGHTVTNLIQLHHSYKPHDIQIVNNQKITQQDMHYNNQKITQQDMHYNNQKITQQDMQYNNQKITQQDMHYNNQKSEITKRPKPITGTSLERITYSWVSCDVIISLGVNSKSMHSHQREIVFHCMCWPCV